MSNMVIVLSALFIFYTSACDLTCRDNCKLLFGELSCYESCGCEPLNINSPIDSIAVQKSNAYIQNILKIYSPQCNSECYGLCGHVLTGDSYANCVENCGCGVILDASLLMQEIPEEYWQGVRPIALRTYKESKNWNRHENSLAQCLNRCTNFCEVAVKSNENCAMICRDMFCHNDHEENLNLDGRSDGYNPPLQPELPSKDDRDKARQDLDELSEIEDSDRLSFSSISNISNPQMSEGVEEDSIIKTVVMQLVVVVSILMLAYGLYVMIQRPKGIVSRKYTISDTDTGTVTAYRRMVKTL